MVLILEVISQKIFLCLMEDGTIKFCNEEGRPYKIKRKILK